jgi:hypothetical protein
MAATNAYVNVGQVPTGSSAATDSQSFSNINATTSAFQLRGGKYGFAVKASTYGTVSLQILLPDGITWATAPGDTGETPALVADGAVVTDLPQGTYRVALT